jgi:hypothetical protein
MNLLTIISGKGCSQYVVSGKERNGTGLSRKF